MEEEQIKIFADSLWDYMLEKKLKQYLSDSVCYYIATVTQAASGGMIKVQRPYDKEVTLPCGSNAEGLAVGDTCTVLVFGDFSNQIVIGDVSKLQAKLTFDNAPIDGSQNPVTSDGIFDAISAADANIAIVENGTTATHNISAGEYVIWQGALYTADTNISSGTSISALNLTAVANGGANDLKVALDNKADAGLHYDVMFTSGSGEPTDIKSGATFTLSSSVLNYRALYMVAYYNSVAGSNRITIELPLVALDSATHVPIGLYGHMGVLRYAVNGTTLDVIGVYMMQSDGTFTNTTPILVGQIYGLK